MKGAHTTSEIEYHFVFCTKYRKPVLTGEVQQRVRELIREICAENRIRIIRGTVSRDHVHLLAACPSALAPSKIMQYLKGKSAYLLFREFPFIRQQLYKGHLWSRGYYAASVGKFDPAIVENYLVQHMGEQIIQ